jgi:hypothetical protein
MAYDMLVLLREWDAGGEEQPAQVGPGEAALVHRRRHQRIQAGVPPPLLHPLSTTAAFRTSAAASRQVASIGPRAHASLPALSHHPHWARSAVKPHTSCRRAGCPPLRFASSVGGLKDSHDVGGLGSCGRMWARWLTGRGCVAQGSFNMCLRHMGFRPTKGARYGGKCGLAPPPPAFPSPCP